MKILQLDSVGGASGDMALAALMDLGVSPRAVRAGLASLKLGRFTIKTRNHAEHGLHGLQVEVRVPDDHHAERRLADILLLIKRSRVPSTVREKSGKVFRKLAEAEATVHDTKPENIHFHEVGALDAIIDIVGSCLALNLIGAEEVAVGPLPSGTGIITCAHGVFPSPAPATVELLKGHPIVQTDEPHELVTPTGAALLMAWKTMESPPAGCRIVKVGHGFGHTRLQGRPNLLRAFLLERADESGSDRCIVLETNLDDTIPELLGSLADRLMREGALDVFSTPVYMKKQRPGTLLTVLCHGNRRDKLVDIIFRESTTFGIREYETRRTVLDRRHVVATTPYGKVRVKIGKWKGKDITRAPEHEDCVRCANAGNVSVRAVYEAALRALRRSGASRQ